MKEFLASDTNLSLNPHHLCYLAEVQVVALSVVLHNSKVQGVSCPFVVNIDILEAPDQSAQADSEKCRQNGQNKLPHHVSQIGYSDSYRQNNNRL